MEKVQAKTSMRFLVIAAIATAALITLGFFIAYRGVLNPSNAPNLVAGTELSQPEVLRIGDSLVWGEVENATGYSVIVEGDELVTIPLDSPRVFVPENAVLENPGIYNIQIIAKGNGASFFDGITNVQYIVTGTLEHISNAVVHTFDESELMHTISWERVAKAVTYTLIIDGVSEVVLQKETGENPQFEFYNDIFRPGTHAISIIAIGDGIVWFDSEPLDDEIYIAPRVLDQAQNISYIEGIISWSPVEFAKNYQIEFSTGEIIDVVGTMYDLKDFISDRYGIFECTIRAVYSATVFSEADFTFIVPKQLSAPFDVVVNGQTISWACNNDIYADYYGAYRIEIGEVTGITNNKYFVWGQAFIPGSTYDIYIYATASGGQTKIYLESDVCHYIYNAPKQEVILASVTGIKVDSNIITWNEVANANGYQVTIDTTTEVVYDTSFEFEFLGGKYDIKIIALGGKESAITNYLSSVEAQLVYRILAAVSLNSLNNTIFWTAVDGANAYAIYVNGEQKYVVQVIDNKKTYELDLAASYLGFANGTYDIQVVAVGGVIFANSNFSQTIRVQIGPATPPPVVPPAEQTTAGSSAAVTAVLVIAGVFAVVFIGYLTVVKIKKQQG